VSAGLDVYTGDAAAIVMADLSRFPEDLVCYYRVKIQDINGITSWSSRVLTTR
jgi:argininosuccinate lyase